MPTPPLRSAVSGTPTRATANTGFGALYDYVVALLGSTGDAGEARAALGLPNTGQLAGLRNVIINGNFGVNQRGYVSGSAVGAANTYTLDRWRVVTSGQALTFAASGNGNSATAPAGGLEQVIEGINIGGGDYVVNWTGAGTCTVNGTARAKGATFTLTANTNATVRIVGVVSQLQIEPGAVATPFEHRPIGLELALCQRYRCNGAIVAIPIPNSLLVAPASARFPVEMRASPTVILSDDAGATTRVSQPGLFNNLTYTALGVTPFGINQITTAVAFGNSPVRATFVATAEF